MDDKANVQCNKLMTLDNSMLMYGIYNAKTLEKLIKTVHGIHNTTSSHERLFAGEYSSSTFRTLYTLFRLTTLFYKFTFISENYSG